jgi:hypothetical protein
MFAGTSSNVAIKKWFRHGGNAGTNRGGHSHWVHLHDYGITVVVFANSNNSGEPYNDNVRVAIWEAIDESFY